MERVVLLDVVAHLTHQHAHSLQVFGPGKRMKMIGDHIRKELDEIEDLNGGLAEWVDVIILAFDGALRSGATPTQIVDAWLEKQHIIECRKWPDWRKVPQDKAIEHLPEEVSMRGMLKAR